MAALKKYSVRSYKKLPDKEKDELLLETPIVRNGTSGSHYKGKKSGAISVKEVLHELRKLGKIL